MSRLYKRNFLNQVILRVDFDAISLVNIKTYQKNLKNRFDKVDNGQVFTGTIELKPGESISSVSSQSSETLWVFSNEERGVRMELSSTNIVLEYTKYKNSEVLRDDLKFVFGIITEDNDIRKVNRVGLRYINKISIPSVKRLVDWSKFIAPELLKMALYLQKTNVQTRIMGMNEFNNDTFVATGFRYGIWNDQYPSPITSSAFILDIDCFTRQSSDLSETQIEDVVKSLNLFSENTFENSITGDLRKIMGEA